jgi:hypothetical protein
MANELHKYLTDLSYSKFSRLNYYGINCPKKALAPNPEVDILLLT